MTSRALINSVPDGSLSAVYRALVDFANRVDELADASRRTRRVARRLVNGLPLNVLGAARFPVKAAGMETIQLGKSGFLHKSVPGGWWEEYTALAKSHFTPMIFLARSSLASFTWTETTRRFEPIGADRWSFELGLKYGMRDGLTYGVGGRCGWSHSGPARSCRIFSPRPHEYPFVQPRASLRYGLSNSLARMPIGLGHRRA